jgi:hypothetical protein
VSRPARGTRIRQDRGAGVISTAFGVIVFLVLLLFTAQLLVNLFFASMVTSAAHDAASDVAHSGVQPPSGGRLGAAEDELRDRLGDAGDQASVRWDTSRADVVELIVSVPYPRLGSSRLQIPFFERLERRILVRVEQVQD